MLIGFKVGNFKSFKETQYFSMLAGKTRSNLNHLIEVNGKKVLKFSGMYGANGSGKSNLILSMSILQSLINNGIDSLISDQYFRADKSCKKMDSYFEYEFSLNNKLYSYGFEMNIFNKEFTSEWLIDMTSNREKIIFTRDIKTGAIANSFTKDSVIAKSCVDEMKNNNKELFLKEVVRRLMMTDKDNVVYSELISIYKFFAIDMIFIKPSTHKLFDTNYVKNKSTILKLFEKMDINISDIIESVSSMNTIQSNMSTSGFDNFQNELKMIFTKNNQKNNLKCTLRLDNDIYTITRSKDDYDVSLIKFKHHGCDDTFGAYEESDGTIRLLELIDIFLSKDKIFIIDELDNSLHPLLVKGILKHFLETTFNNQLIITTHESITLDFDLVRRDEIWFSEKNDKGETTIYSLEQYKSDVRLDKVIKNAYLEGRFGAISNIDL